MYSLNERIEMIFLTRQLLTLTSETLEAMFQDEDSYTRFLTVLKNSLDYYPPLFLLAPSILTKAEDIIQNKRFSFSNLNGLINEIIGDINNLEVKPEDIKMCEKISYISFEEETRKKEFKDANDFVETLAGDAKLITALQTEDLESLPLPVILSSTNYLLRILPEIYEENPNAIPLTIDAILQKSARPRFSIWRSPQRSAVKNTLQNLQKVKKKEE